MAATRFVNVAGANEATYTLTHADLGHSLRVLVSAQVDGRTVTAASAPVGPVGEADVFTLSVLAKTSLTITIGWTPPQGVCGYRFFRDGKPVSTSFDPLKNSIKFAYVPGAVYRVDALGLIDSATLTG